MSGFLRRSQECDRMHLLTLGGMRADVPGNSPRVARLIIYFFGGSLGFELGLTLHM